MVFENNEEFNLESYNFEFDYLIASNSTFVDLYRTDIESENNQQGDYVGITTNSFPAKRIQVEISIFTDTNRTRQLEKSGRISAGQQTYVCYCTKDVVIKNEDTIQYNGKEFNVMINYQAQKSNQLSFQVFDMINIG